MSGDILDACAASRARLTHAHTNRRCCRNSHSRQAPHASGNLRSALWRLNGVGVSLLNADKYTLAIRDQIAIDIDAVDAWAARLISGHPVPADLVVMPCGVDAVELLPGWYDEWALIERERVRQRLLHGLEALSRHLIVEGRCAEAVEAASYTGYATYGRWHKVEELLDPDDVAAGHVVRFRRSPQAKIVRSREPAHPAIVSVDTFTAAQLEQRRRRRGGERGWSSMGRTRQEKKRVYTLRSRIKCSICERKMEGAARRQVVIYYRCNARTLVPGSATALAHPPQIYLREDLVMPALRRVSTAAVANVLGAPPAFECCPSTPGRDQDADNVCADERCRRVPAET